MRRGNTRKNAGEKLSVMQILEEEANKRAEDFPGSKSDRVRLAGKIKWCLINMWIAERKGLTRYIEWEPLVPKYSKALGELRRNTRRTAR